MIKIHLLLFVAVLANGITIANAASCELAYDDGSNEGMNSMSPYAFVVHFTPKSDFTINKIIIYGKWVGGTNHNFDIEIWNKDYGQIYKNSYSYIEIFKEEEFVWGPINVPSIKAGNDFYVLFFDYQSREKNGIYVEHDHDQESCFSHSMVAAKSYPAYTSSYDSGMSLNLYFKNNLSSFTPPLCGKGFCYCNYMIRVVGDS